MGELRAVTAREKAFDSISTTKYTNLPAKPFSGCARLASALSHPASMSPRKSPEQILKSIQTYPNYLPYSRYVSHVSVIPCHSTFA